MSRTIPVKDVPVGGKFTVPGTSVVWIRTKGSSELFAGRITIPCKIAEPTRYSNEGHAPEDLQVELVEHKNSNV